MKRFLIFGLLVFVTSGVFAESGLRDFLLTSFGDDMRTAFLWEKISRSALVEQGEDSLTFKTITGDGHSQWHYYYFVDGGFTMGWMETTTGWHSLERDPTESPWDTEFNMRLKEFGTLTRGSLKLRDKGAGWLLYEGDGKLSGAFYKKDESGYWRFYSFVSSAKSYPWLILKLYLFGMVDVANEVKAAAGKTVPD